MKRLKIFVINSLITLVSTLILQFIGVGFNVYITNKIGEEALGVFSLIMSVYLFGITLSAAGINIASTRVVSEELACNNMSSAKKAAQKSIILSFCTGLIASTIFFIFSDFIVQNCLHNKVSKSVIYPICVALPLIAMSSAIQGYFTALRKVYKNAISKFFEDIVKILFTMVLINSFMPSGLEYACFSLVLGDVVSEIASFALIFLFYIYEKNKNEIRYQDNLTYFQRIFRIAAPVAIASYLRSGLSTLKQVLIPSSLEKSGLSCSEALSKYGSIGGMAMSIIMLPSVFINSFSGLLIPEFSRYYVKKDFKRIKQVTILILTFTTIFSIIVSIILFFFSNSLSLILYHNLNISRYVKIFSFLILFMYLDIVIDAILKGLDEQVSVMIINIIDCITSIGFIYIVVPFLGIKGYLLSIFLSEFLNFILSGYRLFKKLNMYE